MARTTMPDTDLYIVGLGLQKDHLTLQAQKALEQCNSCFYIHRDPELIRYLGGLPGNIIDLSRQYKDRESRIAIYRRMAALVVESAISNPPVSLALYGHPLFLSSLSAMALTAAHGFDRRVTVIPGISSLDTVMADLQVDPGAAALQVQEATDLVLYKRTLDTSRGVLLLQLAHFGSHMYTQTPITSERLGPLAEYLVRIYPESHGIFLVRSPNFTAAPPVIDRLSLAELASKAHRIRDDTTAYIPPLGNPVPDEKFWRSLTSPEGSAVDKGIGIQNE